MELATVPFLLSTGFAYRNAACEAIRVGGVLVLSRMLRTLSAVVVFVSVASPARADLIVVDPNNYASGTNLSTLFTDLTLAQLTNQANSDGANGTEVFRPIAAPVYAISTYHDPTTLSIGGMGYQVDEYESCSTAGASFFCSYRVLEMRFDAPTNFLQIDSIFFSDGPGILAYDAFGNRIYGYTNTYSVGPNNTGASTITMMRPTADIARVVYGGLYGNSTPVRMSYNVPEPMTLGFMGLGLVGAGLFTRRRQFVRH